MHCFDEYSEVHLDPNRAPHRWLFRAHEPILIQFGVLLTKQPTRGQVWVEANDGCGYRDQQLICAEPAGVVCNTYQFFTATLPPLTQGGYHYRLGYCDRTGSTHTSHQTRTVLISDDAPRTIDEVEHAFWGWWMGNRCMDRARQWP